jgi:hypothetical protein
LHILNLLLAFKIIVIEIDSFFGISHAAGRAAEVGKAIDLLHGIITSTVFASIASC